MGREGGVRAQGRAVLLAFGFDPALKKSCVLRLGQHDLDFRAIGFESLAHTVERASRAVARHPVVKLLALKVVEDLLAGGGLVELPVGLVLELVAEEPAVLLAQLLRLAHHARALARLGCHNHLRTWPRGTRQLAAKPSCELLPFRKRRDEVTSRGNCIFRGKG
eukprot:6199608-Pleurochrysis_carterae.AAC.1